MRLASARYGKFPKRGRPAKTDLRYRNDSEVATETISQLANFSLPKRYHCDAIETVALSLSRGGGGEVGGESFLERMLPPPGSGCEAILNQVLDLSAQVSGAKH